ncbi:aminotransferase class V-fold PLP-dependent enzyme [Sinomicrobium weinanense]|uniref:Aminotransferase class V-fold PLP-dependent enzyme n=1 Tax=Sinomicrobium weinanense TaxID=2842200 RepID=A0A926JV68_9FLAO|nr:aminotransferase class V-fold PLP-dependent enzyme [Sinomicrobium weinanense]MBC9798180.1 aminotransferase class V-fold PLP-dependent enzyme [Sinomicrobium weinanense]MBU3125494.1 aminotransferase class V-fold PLP-dependent enzyme [Sinomicrobium weinanense]
MKRREIIKQLGVIPLAGSLMASDSMLGAVWKNPAPLAAKPYTRNQNIYESLGIETIINCRGTFTILGGSTERPEVLEAMEAASGYFVQYDELAFGIGRRLAELTKAEWGMISAGCAAGMKHVTAACVTGGNPEKLIRIPHIGDFEKNEVIIPRSSRNVYDHAIRNIGVKIITVDTPEELKQAINPRTAMIYIMTGPDNETGKPLSLEVIGKMAKPGNIPVLADAAAEDLSIPCVHLERGATVVAYSGGKAICGPQCAGLLLGNKDLLMAAWQASSPHHGPGRDNKIGKEEMLGMLAAVEAWTTRDHDKEWNTWLGWLDEISSKLTRINGITSEITTPTGLNNRAPRLILKWDPDKLHIRGEEVAEEVARNKPRVAIGAQSKDNGTSISITPSQMRPGNAKLVADRLYNVLSGKREPRSDEMTPAKENISGHWEADVEFFTGKSTHKFFLEQDKNWISGTHTSEYAMQEMIGMIEGNEVVLKSNYRVPGNSINFWFIGKVADGEITGSVFLGEYLTARFGAKKVSYRQNRKKLNVPGGPPLAT